MASGVVWTSPRADRSSKAGVPTSGRCLPARESGASTQTDRGAGTAARMDNDNGQNTVTFCVGGENFRILEQTVRAKPDTLLCTLLDDPERQKDSKSKSIFVEADSQRFRYIVDWYRYGSILIPPSIGVEEMRRECAFFQLPDDVKISREDGLDLLHFVRDDLPVRSEVAKKEWQTMAADAVVAYMFYSSLTSMNWQGPASVSVTCKDVRDVLTIPNEMIHEAAERHTSRHGFSLDVNQEFSGMMPGFKSHMTPKSK